MDKQIHVDAIYIDFSKAFDKNDHNQTISFGNTRLFVPMAGLLSCWKLQLNSNKWFYFCDCKRTFMCPIMVSPGTVVFYYLHQ